MAVKSRKIDVQTHKLLKDLLGGAISYTRTTMVDGTLPTLSDIQDARDALQRLKVVGNKVDDQIKDSFVPEKLTIISMG